jgi:hypothetical protein
MADSNANPTTRFGRARAAFGKVGTSINAKVLNPVGTVLGKVWKGSVGLIPAQSAETAETTDTAEIPRPPPELGINDPVLNDAMASVLMIAKSYKDSMTIFDMIYEATEEIYSELEGAEAATAKAATAEAATAAAEVAAEEAAGDAAEVAAEEAAEEGAAEVAAAGERRLAVIPEVIPEIQPAP